MRLSRVRPGDIVAIGNGDGYHATVLHVNRGWLDVIGLGNHARRKVKAHEVTTHWRLASSDRSRRAAKVSA